MKKYDLYLFDFDGTLLDTMPALEFVFRASFEHVGLSFDPKDTVEFARVPLTVSYKKQNGTPEKWEEFVRYIDASLDFPEALHSNKPYEETMESVKYMRDNKVVAGIATSNNKNHVLDVLKYLGIPEDTFAIIIGNKECHKFKPHPDPILKALEAINYKGDLSRVAYVGDAMNDTIAANEAGVQAILIDRIDAFPESDQYIKIKNLMELFQ